MPPKSHVAPRVVNAKKSSRVAQPAAHTFVVRLWQERSGEDALWRGTVSDLRGRQLGSFGSATELVRILGGISGVDVLLRLSSVRARPGMN
jgi:hypothetical protein